MEVSPRITQRQNLFKDCISGRDSTKLPKLSPSKYIGKKTIWWGGEREGNGEGNVKD